MTWHFLLALIHWRRPQMWVLLPTHDHISRVSSDFRSTHSRPRRLWNIMLLNWDLANKSGLDTALYFRSWPLPLDGLPVSPIHESNQLGQNLQKPDPAESALPSLLFTPPCSDPINQISWHSSGLQPLNDTPYQQYAEELDRYEPYVLRTPTLPLVYQARSCQSNIPQKENFREKQMATLPPESEKAVAIPAVADFGNVTTHPSADIRSANYILYRIITNGLKVSRTFGPKALTFDHRRSIGRIKPFPGNDKQRRNTELASRYSVCVK